VPVPTSEPWPDGPQPASATPPGWYPTPGGWVWWDGYRWVPPAGGGASNERTLAMLAHLSVFFGGIILSGILWATSEQKPFTRRHARSALNFGLTFLICYFGAFAVLMVGFVLLAIAPVVGVVLLVVAGLAVAGLLVAHYVWGVMGAMRASRGEEWEYPICFDLVKG